MNISQVRELFIDSLSKYALLSPIYGCCDVMFSKKNERMGCSFDCVV